MFHVILVPLAIVVYSSSFRSGTGHCLRLIIDRNDSRCLKLLELRQRAVFS